MAKENSYKIEIDIASSRILAEKSADMSATNNEYQLKMIETVRRTLNNLLDWIQEFKTLVSIDEHEKAYDLFYEKQSLIPYLKQDVSDDLLLLDRSKIEKEKRKLFSIYLIEACAANYGKIEHVIDELYREFENEFDFDLKQHIILAKANAAANNNRNNVAYTNYKKILSNVKTKAITQAYALRGLSIIAPIEEEVISYTESSAEKFLEAGEIKEAAINLEHISSLYDNKDINLALEYLDRAIDLYSGDNILNREYFAGLYHRKGTYLYFLTKYKDAFASIEFACKLRENIVGNESSKYSSLQIAVKLCEILDETEKLQFYSSKLAEIILTSDPKLVLEARFLEKFKEGGKLSQDLQKEIEMFGNNRLKFGLYTYNSTISNYSFSEKIEWLDKASLIINPRDFYNIQYAMLHFTLAEVYREEDMIDEAVLNYEKALDHNLGYKNAIQNCGAVLWKAKKWDKSKEFFKKQIDRSGESPILCYGLARSYFELELYKEAFPYFLKAKGKIKGADMTNFIELCMERSSEITLESPKLHDSVNVPSISLKSFYDTLLNFAKYTSSNSRMHFWVRGKEKEHKWISSPEENAKQLLIAFISAKYGEECVDIMDEVKTGAGIMDLYICLRGGLRVIVELKMCGGGYSSTYALNGESQLIHYLKNKSTHIGFLIVFDGRINDFGLGFKKNQVVGCTTIYTIPVEMKPIIEKRSI